MSRRGKKEVEAIVSAMGIFTTIISLLVELVKKLGGTMENIYRLATPEGRETLEAVARLIVGGMERLKNLVYAVLVDFGMSIEELVRLGKYYWSNNDITSEHFPTKRVGKVETNVEFIHFGRNISSNDALKEMDKMGYRPAEAHELLAFGAKYPDVQREFPIVALGSVWRGPGGGRFVVCLRGRDALRFADLLCFEGDWLDYWRFAAIRK